MPPLHRNDHDGTPSQPQKAPHRRPILVLASRLRKKRLSLSRSPSCSADLDPEAHEHGSNGRQPQHVSSGSSGSSSSSSSSSSSWANRQLSSLQIPQWAQVSILDSVSSWFGQKDVGQGHCGAAGVLGSKKRRVLLAVFALALVNFVAMSSFMDGRGVNKNEPSRELEVSKALLEMTGFQSVDLTNEQMQRLLLVAKTKWPECVNQRMSAAACKTLIDKEILEMNTDTDKFVRTIVVGKRDKGDSLYNSMVIPMGDDDRVLGRDGDCKVHYDFTWDGSGEEASNYEKRKIPPIVAQEIISAPTEDSILWNDTPVRILGAKLDDAIRDYLNDPISGGGKGLPLAGGVMTVGTETNTNDAAASLEVLLSESVEIAPPGKRTITPIECCGLTGESCCALIKHQIRDKDTQGNAIQCYLDYKEGTVKHRALLNSRGKKVFIFENHKGYITKDPKVVGDWPKGITGTDFHNWILDGGGLSEGQMKLIYPDGVPPDQV